MKGGKYNIKEASHIIEEYRKTIDELNIYEPLNIFDFSKNYDEQTEEFKSKIKNEEDKLNNLGLDSDKPLAIKNLSLRFLIEEEIEKIEDGIKNIENYFDINNNFTKKEGVELDNDMEELLKANIVEGYYEYMIIIRDRLFKSSNSKLQEKITEEDDKDFINKSLIELKNPTKSEEPEKVQKEKEEKEEKQSIISEEKEKKENEEETLKKTEEDEDPSGTWTTTEEVPEKLQKEEEKNEKFDKNEREIKMNTRFKKGPKGFKGSPAELRTRIREKMGQLSKGKGKERYKEKIEKYNKILKDIDNIKNTSEINNILPNINKYIQEQTILSFDDDKTRLKGGTYDKITKTKKRKGKRTKKRTFKSKFLLDI